jgi:hypothetical protein
MSYQMPPIAPQTPPPQKSNTMRIILIVVAVIVVICLCLCLVGVVLSLPTLQQIMSSVS